MSDKGRAAAKGSLGCVAAFVVLGLLAVIFGGSVYIDAGGLVLLLVIGAVIGLVVNSIYQKGKRDGKDPPDDFRRPDDR